MDTELIRLFRSVVGETEAQVVSRVLVEDGYLGMGKEVQAFEAKIADFLGVPENRVICVNSGNVALHLAVKAIAQTGEEILVQFLTFLASFQAITAAGCVPIIPWEVVPETATLNLVHAQTRLTPRTKAVMPVDFSEHRLMKIASIVF